MLGVASDGFVALGAPHPSEQTQPARCLRSGGIQAKASVSPTPTLHARMGRPATVAPARDLAFASVGDP
jgi:hypothetical protein